MLPPRPTLLLVLALALASGTSALARETLEIPAVSLELAYGGGGKLTVDGKSTALTAEQAAQLRADLAPLHTETLSRDLTKVQELEAAVAKATREAELCRRAVEREQDRVGDQQRQIASLEKRQKEVQDELKEATERGYNTSLDNLRSKLNAIGSSLASERKELERARERLVIAEKRKVENEAKLNAAAPEAAALRKALVERVEKVKALTGRLKAKG